MWRSITHVAENASNCPVDTQCLIHPLLKKERKRHHCSLHDPSIADQDDMQQTGAGASSARLPRMESLMVGSLRMLSICQRTNVSRFSMGSRTLYNPSSGALMSRSTCTLNLTVAIAQLANIAADSDHGPTTIEIATDRPCDACCSPQQTRCGISSEMFKLHEFHLSSSRAQPKLASKIVAPG
jgi:hypothetical protein